MSSVINETYSVEVLRDSETGEKVRERWTLDGKLHRTDGPALQGWDNGKLTAQEWWLKDKPSRLGGKPACLEIDPDSDVVVSEKYFVDGKPHKLGGPALIERDALTGQVTMAHYYRDGQKLHSAPNIDQAHTLDGPEPPEPH